MRSFRPRRVRWRLLAAAVIVVTLVAVLTGRKMNEDPVVTIPGNALPSPNAYDYYVKAGSRIVDNDKTGDALGTPLSGKGRIYSLAEKEALVQENAPALSVARAGFAFPYNHPAERVWNVTFTPYGRDRGLARLFRLEAEVKAAHGDWGGAAESDLDAVRLGEDVPHGSVLIGMLVGVACQAIGRRALWAAVPHLNAAQARMAARRLEAIQERHTPFADTMQEEEWFGQTALMTTFHSVHWRRDAINTLVILPNSGNDTPKTRAYVSAWMLTLSKRAIFNNYTRYMNQIVRNARLPYAAQGPLPPLSGDPVNQTVLPIFANARIKDTDSSITQNALLTVTLAVRAYQLEHGKPPDTPAALVPAYLSKVPDDPFARSGPMRSVKRGGALVVYSVGPDGKDDGGKAINDTTQPAPSPHRVTNARRWVLDASKGDIVAGVNIY